MLPASVHVAVLLPPLTVSAVTPVPLLPIIGVNEPLPVPVKVKVGDVFVPLSAMLPALENVNAALPEAFNVPPLVPRVNKRSVLLLALPEYSKVPPLITKLVAALLD